MQIAQWTEKLKQLEEHMRRYPRDKNAKYVATHIAARRHKMLKYLRRRDFETYFRIIVALGLEDIQPMPFPQKHRFDIHEVRDTCLASRRASKHPAG